MKPRDAFDFTYLSSTEPPMTRRIEIGPINRVEGDVQVARDLDGSVVRRAEVSAGLYRGFEQMLPGRSPGDALVYTPRICGICSISQSLACVAALEAAANLRPVPNGLEIRRILHGAENLADHLSHFYLFFMPDFARDAYAGRPWHIQAVRRFKSSVGEGGRGWLAARAQWLHMVGMLAGHWPHTLVFQLGGVSRAVDKTEIQKARGLIAGLRRFLERELFALPLEQVAAWRCRADLEGYRWRGQGDFALFLQAAADLDLAATGGWPEWRLGSGGAYPGSEGVAWPAGVWSGAGAAPFDPDAIVESTAHAWLAGEGDLPPARGLTRPDADKAEGYTWSKAPRLNGRPLEVGALARQAVAGQPLIRDLLAGGAPSVAARIVARMMEVAQLPGLMLQWLDRIDPEAPFIQHHDWPVEGRGVGLVEAARGGLGHWVAIEAGKIAAYQIVAPTTWNFSPRDGQGVPGPLEQALEGVEAEGETGRLRVQQVVRAFDPCMVCTVH